MRRGGSCVKCSSNIGHGGAWEEQAGCDGPDADLPAKEAPRGEGVDTPISVLLSWIEECYH